MKTLADLKRELAKPNATLTLLAYAVSGEPKPHVYAGVARTVHTLQTNAVALSHPENGKVSWLTFGKAGDWKFDGNVATYADAYISLTYELSA